MVRSFFRRSPMLPLGLGLCLAATLLACGGGEPASEETTAAPADAPAEGPAATETGGGASSATTPAVENPVEPADMASLAGNVAPEATAAERDAILGDPLVVNGEKISLDEIRRYTLLSSNARALFELAKIQVYIDQEINRQIEQEGKTRADFAVDQKEVDEAIQRAEAGVRQQFEGQDVNLDDYYPTKDPGWLGQVKQTRLFKKVFLPENPYEYPPITAEAFGNGEEGENILSVLHDDWDRTHGENAENAETTETAEDKQKSDAGNRMFDMMLTQQVISHLNDTAVILGPEDGIPAHLLGIVNGVEITVDSIWKEVWPTISAQDVWKAKQFLVNTTLLRQDLEKSGFLMSKEEADAIWEEQAAPYRNSFFSLEKMALSIKKFPTLGMYRTYHRLYESFQRAIADEMTDEVLEKQGRDRTAAIVSLVDADVDIILLSAYDFKKKKWIENGWEKAAAQAKEVSQKLAAGEDWNMLLDEYSGFYDPPLPTLQRENPDVLKERFNKGRLRGWIRNRLMTKLDEPEFLLFLNGTSITDIIFFEMKVGSIENPIRGPYGYYIPKLLRRSAPTMSLSANDSKSRPYLVQDYVAMRMRQRAQELAAEGEVTGL